MNGGDKLVRFYLPSLFLLLIFFSISVQTTYGNNYNNLKPILQGIAKIYTDSKNGFVFSVSQIINQTKTSGVELVGKVTHVTDGDTLDINGITIRLSLVDTPEKGQPGFKKAKEFVSSLCLGKKGELDVDDGERRGDRFGRELGIVYCNGANINEKLVNDHLARILTNYCDISEFSKESWATASCNAI